MDVTSAWDTNVMGKLVYMYRGKMMGENILVKQTNIKSPKSPHQNYPPIYINIHRVNVSSLKVDPKHSSV